MNWGDFVAVILTVGTNSYISVGDATAYLSARLNTSAWSGASEDDKARALITATRTIDRQLLKGKKKLSTQALQFPRCYRGYGDAAENIGNLPELVDEDGWLCETSVPQAVINACCEEALALLDTSANSRRRLQMEGVKSFSLGSLSETFGGVDSASKGLVSQEAQLLIKPFLAGAVRII